MITSRARVASTDPFGFKEQFGGQLNLWDNNAAFNDTNGQSIRAGGLSINPAIRTLVLILSGQSNYCTQAPTAYTPLHNAVVDNFNIRDGQVYACPAGALLGCSWLYKTFGGQVNGHFGGQLADLLIANNKFDRVILVPIASAGSSVLQWQNGAVLQGRHGVAMRRLASRGIVPGMPGVTFAVSWGQGESDQSLTALQYTTAFADIMADLAANGFSGRVFVNQQTWLSGVVSATIAGAQASLANGATIFAGANADSLLAASRQSDNTHFNDAGLASLTTLLFNAFDASGAPF